MTPERRRRHIPEWAQRERMADLAWVAENLHILWPAAEAGYRGLGRGALVVDTISQPEPDKGNPFGYFSQEQLMEFFGKDAFWLELERLLSQHDPTWEFVALLLKEQRESVYRIGVPGQQPSST